MTATDLVLEVTQKLRKLGVVGKFVEFYGPGAVSLPVTDRATIANMAPEMGRRWVSLGLMRRRLRICAARAGARSTAGLTRITIARKGCLAFRRG